MSLPFRLNSVQGEMKMMPWILCTPAVLLGLWVFLLLRKNARHEDVLAAKEQELKNMREAHARALKRANTHGELVALGAQRFAELARRELVEAVIAQIRGALRHAEESASREALQALAGEMQDVLDGQSTVISTKDAQRILAECREARGQTEGDTPPDSP